MFVTRPDEHFVINYQPVIYEDAEPQLFGPFPTAEAATDFVEFISGVPYAEAAAMWAVRPHDQSAVAK